MDNIELDDFELQQKIETLLLEYTTETRSDCYNGYPQHRKHDEVLAELKAAIFEGLHVRDMEIERLKNELVPYHNRDSYEAHVAKQKLKLEFVLDLLFPHNNYDKPEGTPRELRHPEKYWWWNGYSILEESEPNEVTGDIDVEVESYVGGGENEKYSFKVLGHWIEPDDYEEIKKRVHSWCRTANASNIKKANEKSRQEALHKIAEAERTIARLKGEA
jgi:hypothetical protein